MQKLKFLPIVKIYHRSLQIKIFSKPFENSYVLGASIRRFGQQSIRSYNQLSEDVKRNESAITVSAKVKQVGKDASYMGILLIGFGVTGALIWYIASELIFSFSSNAVYSKALKLVKDHPLVVEEIGNSIKGYGEETSRGRRRHVNYQQYVVDDVNYMRVQFYVSGSKRKGTVYADAMETSRGNFQFRYIFVEMQGYPVSQPIVVLDNR
ncbi:mitochondrial import inner membrane translocase subunit Tim21-like [Hydra vulgaris]|uniref:Mitochondrial import inner membrane translocase subunit Tim21 n=1 Tax=Hydra vulgaris TaxID=6087 RepID=A0ABM4DQJ5_HYDVU